MGRSFRNANRIEACGPTRAAGVPAYVVFHDKTLAAIASARPMSLAELLRVSGAGESKLRKYGNDVLEVLRAGPA